MRTVTASILTIVLLAASGIAIESGPGADPPVALEQVLFQDFETPLNWNGSDPPSGWTVVDNGTSDGIWDSYDWSKYSAWGGSTARISGASSSRYNNDWIVSPSIDFSGASACTLLFRHYYDDYVTQAADSALVLLSDDGGSTWGDTVAVYAGSDYGNETAPDSEYFDISSFAAGRSAVKAAFQYVKRQPVLVASWRLDDIAFHADGSVLMNQDFESSWGPNGDNPPSGWAINDVNVVKWDDNDWHQASIAGWGNIAYVFWSPVEQQNELLKSPSMDFTDSTFNILLSLKQWYDDQTSARDTAFILGSVDGGGTWAETLAVYQGTDRGSSSSPAYDTLDIVSWANNQANAVIGFKYAGNNDGKWYIDSIRVERIDMLPRDVKVVSITAPPDPNIKGYDWPVSAVVENIGLNPMSFQVVFNIADTNGAAVYSDTQSVSSLPSQEQRAVNFAEWPAGESQTHYLTCFIRSITDLNHSNDTLRATAYTYDHAGSAGPVEGWSYRDNTAGGSEFYWIDISSTGTPITFADNDNGNSGMIDMGISFDFFGASYSRVAVSTDGWLSFIDSTGTDSSPSAIPDLDGPGAMIALLWADLHLRAGHVYYYRDVPADQFIVQYDSVEFASAPGSDIGMEVIFDGAENTIKMQYRYLPGEVEPNVTIGIENLIEDTGLPFNNYGQYGQSAMPGLAITYTFLLPHDVRTFSIDEPQILIRDGQTYEIRAQVRNVGANTETFDVVAYDNSGYVNTQTVTGLQSLDFATVTFPAWAISNACSTYKLNVYCALTGDLNPANDTLSLQLEAINSANVDLALDGGQPGQIEWYEPDTILANAFDVLYSGATLSAVGYRFNNDELVPDLPDDHKDSVWVYIFLDANSDNIPDDLPAYTAKVLAAKSGWTIWNVACDTTITLACERFWAGWSNVTALGMEGIVIDQGLNYPNQKWIKQGGAWELCTTWPGDYMIRAYVSGDPATAPDIGLGATQVAGAASPDGADTVTTYIQNTGTGCDLRYKVKVLQTVTGLNGFDALPRPNLPRTLDSGGPDNYGYTWQDSDEPGGPEFIWIDITGTGTEVTWDHGDSDDGYTDPIPMGMTFNYYGANYDSIVISANGWASFNTCRDPFAFSSNGMIPVADEINALFAACWDNLDGGAGGQCRYYHYTAANAFIISWTNWGHNPGAIDPHDFQIIFDGIGGTIQFNYIGANVQTDITVGIENEDGKDGLLIAYEEPYLHGGLTVQIKPPIFWLSTDLPNGILPPLSLQTPFNIIMNSQTLPVGVYNGAVVTVSNDINEPEAYVNVQFEVEGVCAYLPGDVNGSGNSNGIDVTFMVNFFRGGSAPHDECPPCASIGTNMLYPQGDVNGTCVWNGIDVTYFVNFLKGIGPTLRYCDQCPPAVGLARQPSGQDEPGMIIQGGSLKVNPKSGQ